MRITALRIKDFKRITDLEIDADRALIILGGRNGAGKTTALDAIACALVGAKAIPDEPIRRGADRGEVEVTLDGVTVKRTFTRAPDGKIGGTLTIKTADGMRPTSPQSWLDSKLGDLACDPLAFMAADPAKQAERLRKIAGVDTSALDNRRKAVFDERTDIGRDGKRDGAILDAMPHYPDAPAAYVTAATVEPVILAASDVLAELDAATATERIAADADRAYTSAAARHSAADRDLGERTARVAELRQMLDLAERAEANARTAMIAAGAIADDAQKAAQDAAGAVVDAAPIRARLAALEGENTAARAEAMARNAEARKAAEEVNAQIRANEARAKALAGVTTLRATYVAKTADLDAIDKERTALIAAAKFPVEGLGFGADGGVTFNGYPLSQASGAERIRVSMGIALAANPTIRVVLIRDASLMDEESMALVVKLAEEADAQVWLERVGTSDAGAVVITDGAVS